MSKSSKQQSPPRWSTKLLRFFLRNEFLEEVEGDMKEIFEDNLEQYSIKKARRIHNREVIKLLRPILIRKLSGNKKLNYIGMLQHNLILTFRSYMRYKSAFFINLLGLATGLACTLLIYLWVDSELQVNQFHDKSDRIYRVVANNAGDNGISTNYATPGLLPQTLAAQFPEVEYATTESWTAAYTLSHEQTNIKALGQYAGEDYFNVFSYQLLQGDKNKVLKDKSAIVISDELALKLFGTTTDVVGKTVEFMHFKSFQVSGVFKSPPATSSHQFDFIMTFEEFKESRPWILDWKNSAPSTFVALTAGAEIDAFNAKIKDIIRNNNGEPHMTPYATLYVDLYLNGKFVNGKPTAGKMTYVRLFSIIALFILAIACINFMNLSTARVSRRLKEIGIKKAVGASRKSLIVQFIGESMVMAFIALVTALLLVWFVLPTFNEITGKQLVLMFSQEFGLLLLTVLLITGLLAGSYPALYLSGFKPIKILKGQSPSSWRELFMRKGLVVFQFTLSIVLIVSVLVVYKQIEFTQKGDIGFDKDNIIYFEAEGALELKLQTFLEEVKRIPGVQMASSTAHSFVEGGYNGSTYDMAWKHKNPETVLAMEYMRVNHDFIEVLDFEIIAGRSYSKEFATDLGGIIFNQTAIKAMNLADPVGESVNIFGQNRQVLGVVKDFNFRSFREAIGPAFFILNPSDTWVIMAKLQAGKESATITALQKLYGEVNPGFDFDYKFLSDDYAKQYDSEQRIATLSRAFAIVAVLISCLGLFGLAAFTAERRLKEIGIRKILGSSSTNIVRLLSGDFTKMVLVAITIALPISYYVVSYWLQGFAYSVDLEWWFFAGSGAVALFIAWLTVGFQTLKASRINPAQCLRSE